MRRIVYLAILLVFIGVSTATVSGVDVRFVKEIPLVSNDKEPKGELQKVVDFCVTDDGIFLFPDYNAGNIKLYEQNGEALVFLKNVGSKGYYGPGCFVKPAFCSFNKAENKFVIVDMGTKRIYLYDRNKRDEFVREKKGNGNEVYGESPSGAYDTQLLGSKLFVAGYVISGGNFYSMDLSELKDSNLIKAKPKLFLTSKEIYLINKNDDFEARIGAKYLEAIGYRNYFDIEGNFAYFVWMGNLRIIKIDISSDSKVKDSFGKKTRNYAQPEPETAKFEALAKAFHLMVINRKSQDKNEYRDKYIRERRKFSIIQNLFTTSEHVILVYEGPYIDGNSENFHVQFYSLDGKFIAETPLRGRPDSIIRFNRDKKILYFLSESESKKGTYSILTYKISEGKI